jgi:hypothetical protein
MAARFKRAATSEEDDIRQDLEADGIAGDGKANSRDFL